ncbi:glycoside hydrolase family 61 protein [Schizophyllum amplum]|uniref:AA9 family lytic polysaccharide monooxygenase n=1 Tax=Schizophyllum amplum TaxID=97359 RepID=A0A550C7F7_9AGAR|nr:glycoside hydrolase family 61 protein [Auriculariopsis ampla]
MVKLASFAILGSLIATATAHTRVWGVYVNGEYQGDGASQYVRSPPTNNPIKDLTSSSMMCNVNNAAVSKRVSVAGGDELTFEWYHNYRNDDIIASSHHGPIQVYMSGDDGATWTKIFSDSYDTSSSTWAVDRLLTSAGKHSVIIPDVPAGNYLLRAEILALHEADVTYTSNPIRGAQNYPSCTQITVTSNGADALPANGVKFPGAYTDSSPGIVFNVWPPYGPDPATYVAPGPAVWDKAPGGSI